VAAGLSGTGLRRGDAVGLVSANTVEFVVALLGAARAGLVVAPLDPTLPHTETSVRLGGLGAQAILVGLPAVDSAPAWRVTIELRRPGGPVERGIRAAACPRSVVFAPTARS
jgi:acyl-CoA synthetase (AMP-forming)/AMP-acid ligase II